VGPIRLRRTRKRLRFANNRLVCRSVGGVAAGSNAEHEKIACCGRSRDLLIIYRTPITGTVNNRALPESFRREGQHDPSPQSKPLGLLQSNKISAASGRTDNRHSVHLAKSFANTTPNLLDVHEGKSRHLRLWQINPASSKRDYGCICLFIAGHLSPRCHCTK
jgi:hypothetical protein